MENLELGLLLMSVGMATVFAILLIIIYLGKGLILLVNKYAPEETVVKKKHPTVSSAVTMPTDSLSTQETAVIVSAVSMASHGLGKVTKIEKL